MTLTGAQVQRVADAIRRAYSRDELRRIMFVGMNEEFDDLVADKAYADQVFELVRWANRQDRAIDLLRCAYENNPTNEVLWAIWHEFVREPAGDVHHVEASSDVFLSFSHHDLALAKRLCADLEAAGVTVWTDGNLAPGTQNWQNAIEAAIAECKCMVVVMTPQAKESRWVRIEVDLAQEIERLIIPLLASAERKDAVLFSLRDVQYLDVRSDYASVVTERLIPAVRSLLGKKVSDQAAPQIDTLAPQGEASTAKPAVPTAQEGAKPTTSQTAPRAVLPYATNRPTLAQRQALHQALVHGFSLDDLRIMLLLELGLRLDLVTADGPLPQVVVAVLRWAEDEGRLDELVAGALRNNPNNLQLQHYAALYGIPGAA